LELCINNPTLCAQRKNLLEITIKLSVLKRIIKKGYI